MEAVLREIRQLLSAINETLRNSKKAVVMLANVGDAVGAALKRLDKIEKSLEKLEKSNKK